jgi:hypothetical protein
VPNSFVGGVKYTRSPELKVNLLPMVCTSVGWLFFDSLWSWFLEKFKERNSGFKKFYFYFIFIIFKF